LSSSSFYVDFATSSKRDYTSVVPYQTTCPGSEELQFC